MDEWREQELYKAMMILPIEGLKIICWINGGAAIAILTYVGNFASKTPGGPLPQIKTAVAWYCAGLSAAAVTFLISYLVQLAVWASLHQIAGLTFVLLRHRILIWLGCLLSLFGVFSFIMGSLKAASVLTP